MEASTSKQAAKKRSPEKRLPTARAFPVCQPGSKEEISYKSQREDKAGNQEQELYLQHRREKNSKHYKP